MFNVHHFFHYFLKMLFKSTALLIFMSAIMKSCYTAYIDKEELGRFDRIRVTLKDWILFKAEIISKCLKHISSDLLHY